MSDETYQTYWLCRGQKLDYAGMRKALSAGERVIIEVSAKAQRIEAEQKAELERRKAEQREESLPPYRVAYGPEQV